MATHFSRALLASVVAATACSNNSNSTTPTTPTTPSQTVTFTDTLTTNGAKTFQFTTASSGTVTTQLTTLTATNTGQTVSLSLGTWNGAACQIILANDVAAQGAVVTGTVSTASNLCTRISDANGSIPGPTPFVITVVHP